MEILICWLSYAHDTLPYEYSYSMPHDILRAAWANSPLDFVPGVYPCTRVIFYER